MLRKNSEDSSHIYRDSILMFHPLKEPKMSQSKGKAKINFLDFISKLALGDKE